MQPVENHIQILCPCCEKKYFVATKSLAPGQARFQCTSCSALFAFNWLSEVEGMEYKTYSIEKVKHSKKCFKCGFACEEGAKECPQCGIVFEKNAKAQEFVKTKVREVEAAWNKVKENYGEQSIHEEFIKLCTVHDQLAFSSHQYKTVLLANPNDEIAFKMQRVISALVEGKNQSAQKQKSDFFVKFGFYKITVSACIFSMLLGLSFTSLRSLVALGTSILFFLLVFKFWISESEV